MTGKPVGDAGNVLQLTMILKDLPPLPPYRICCAYPLGFWLNYFTNNE